MLKRLGRAWALRPLACAALGLSLGLALGRSIGGGVWPPPAGLALIAVLAGAGGLAALWSGRHRELAWTLLAAGLALGLLRVQALAVALSRPVMADHAGLRLQGRLALDDGPRPTSQRHLYVLEDVRVQAVGDPAAPWEAWPGRVRASVGMEEAATLGLLPGDKVQLYGDLRGVERPSNPGEFDYRSYLYGKGIFATVSARQGWPLTRTAAGAWFLPRRLAARAQAWMTRGLAAGLQARDLILAKGIVLGDKTGLSREDLAAYSRSGLADLLAVSGTHFTLALGLFLLVARAFTPSKRWQAAIGLALGLAYAMVTGFESPVQRAFALFALWLLGRLSDLDTELPTSLAAGALAILWVQPGALWEPGFQLSFLTTLAVVTLGPAMTQRLPLAWPHWLRQGLGALLAAQWALLPLLAYHFHQACWPALFASLLSGAFTFLILAGGLPLSLLGAWVPGVGWLLGHPLAWVLRALDAVSAFSAGLPGSCYSTGLIPLALLAAFLLWALCFLFARGHAWSWALGLSAPVLLWALLWQGLPWRHRHAGLTRVWCLDIGQGDSTVLEFGDGRALLIDGGPALPDAGAWVVVPALRALGVQRLNWVLATHADADHVGGLAWVLDQMPVRELLWNGQPSDSAPWVAVLAQASARHVPMRALGTAVPWTAEDGPWAVLNPSPPARRPRRQPKKPDTNGASVVLRVEDWLLMTGDLPKKGEARLLKAGLKPVQVLKVGHHGSKGSTSDAFVRALHPAVATISCGRRNTYGHPTREALQALSGVRLYRTDLEGCLRLEHGDDGKLAVKTWWPEAEAELWMPRLRPRSVWSRLQRSGSEEESLP